MPLSERITLHETGGAGNYFLFRCAYQNMLRLSPSLHSQFPLSSRRQIHMQRGRKKNLHSFL